jgi:hypothetical protein
MQGVDIRWYGTAKEVYTTLALENGKLAVILRKLGDLAAKDANGYKDALSGKSGNEEVAHAVKDLRGTMAVSACSVPSSEPCGRPESLDHVINRPFVST